MPDDNAISASLVANHIVERVPERRSGRPSQGARGRTCQKLDQSEVGGVSERSGGCSGGRCSPSLFTLLVVCPCQSSPWSLSVECVVECESEQQRRQERQDPASRGRELALPATASPLYCPGVTRVSKESVEQTVPPTAISSPTSPRTYARSPSRISTVQSWRDTVRGPIRECGQDDPPRDRLPPPCKPSPLYRLSTLD